MSIARHMQVCAGSLDRQMIYGIVRSVFARDKIQNDLETMVDGEDDESLMIVCGVNLTSQPRRNTQ